MFEDEVEVDSSFPLGPDDLVVEGDVEPVALDELDYANVFGPVEGDLSIPDLDAPPTERRRRGAKPAYEDDLYVFEDDDRHWPVPEPRGGRRRELVALGLAAGVIVALGVGSQVFAKPDRQENVTEQSTTSTTRPRVRTSDTSAPDLTLPTVPADEPADAGGVTVTTKPAHQHDGEGQADARRPRRRPRTTRRHHHRGAHHHARRAHHHRRHRPPPRRRRRGTLT